LRAIFRCRQLADSRAIERIPLGSEVSDDYDVERFGELVGWTADGSALVRRERPEDPANPRVFVVPCGRLRLEFLPDDEELDVERLVAEAGG
jgi:hypothetical protein